jgi:hypothetical protein
MAKKKQRRGRGRGRGAQPHRESCLVREEDIRAKCHWSEGGGGRRRDSIVSPVWSEEIGAGGHSGEVPLIITKRGGTGGDPEV